MNTPTGTLWKVVGPLVLSVALSACGGGGDGGGGTAPAATPFAVTASSIGSGSGTISMSPGTVLCLSKCQQNYPAGTVVTLNASPKAGSVFSGWLGACANLGSCSFTVNGDTSVMAIFTVAGQQAQIGRYRIPTRGLWTQFERRGWPAEWWPGQVIQQFQLFDSIVGTTVKDEVALQLDQMKAMGLNTLTAELRSADGSGPCPIPSVLGFQWPQPTATELANLKSFLDLLQQKGMRLILALVNTHMEEQPPTKSQMWLGAILNTVKNHSALDLVSFNGEAFMIDTNGDGVLDTCGGQAEPPLWMGPAAIGASYVKWAINYGISLGFPARQLSAEAVIGDIFVDSQPPGGPSATNGHLWSPIVVLKQIFDELGIPAIQRTYAVSFYEHRKCETARSLPCSPDVDPHSWAEQTIQSVLNTIGNGSGARVVAPEMGDSRPIGTAWPPERALESLLDLEEKYGFDGGGYWHWVSIDNAEDTNPTTSDAVKLRGVSFTYRPVQKLVLDMGGFHLISIPNGSFENDTDNNAVPDGWTRSGNGTVTRYFLAGESGQPQVSSRGTYNLRLVTGSAPTDVISARSASITVSPNTTYTTTSNLRFVWSGDPNPGGSPASRPHVYVAFWYFQQSGLPSSVKAQDLTRFFQEDSMAAFDTFPLVYTTPSDAESVSIEVGAVRNGLPTPITFEVDSLR